MCDQNPGLAQPTLQPRILGNSSLLPLNICVNYIMYFIIFILKAHKQLAVKSVVPLRVICGKSFSENSNEMSKPADSHPAAILRQSLPEGSQEYLLTDRKDVQEKKNQRKTASELRYKSRVKGLVLKLNSCTSGLENSRGP